MPSDLNAHLNSSSNINDLNSQLEQEQSAPCMSKGQTIRGGNSPHVPVPKSATYVDSTESMSVSEKPTTFTCFGKLPLELRRQIWNNTCMLPRIITLEISYSPDGYCYHLIEHSNFGPHCPSVLRVCSEAREVALEIYNFRPASPKPAPGPHEGLSEDSPPEAILNSGPRMFMSVHDTLYIRLPYERSHTSHGVKLFPVDLQLGVCKKIAIDEEMILNSWNHTFMQCFMWTQSVVELIIIERDSKELPSYSKGDICFEEIEALELLDETLIKYSNFATQCSAQPLRSVFGRKPLKLNKKMVLGKRTRVGITVGGVRI